MVRLPLHSRLSSHRGNHSEVQQAAAGASGSRSTSPAKNHGHSSSPSSLMLRVQVIKARDLAAKDKGNTSDPYLVLHLGDARDSTVPIHKSLNPEWNETIDLPVVGLQSMLLEVVCWDKDRFGKEYMGEFDVLLEDVFTSGYVASEPRWYKLQSRKSGRKKSFVTGEVLLSFALHDPLNALATPEQLQQRLLVLAAHGNLDSDEMNDAELEKLDHIDSIDSELDMDSDDVDEEEEGEDETEGIAGIPDEELKGEMAEKRKRRLKLRQLKSRAKRHVYEFNGFSDVAGVLFIEITKITDLPPERNVTRTSFDVDPFVVTSLGKKTYRTKVIKHNLNPVYDEKLVFRVARHEQKYSLQFSVVDRDKLSGNDFIGTALLPVESVSELAPQTDPDTGLYAMSDPSTWSQPMSESKRSRFRIPLSRNASSNHLGKLASQTSSHPSSSQSTTPLATPKLQSSHSFQNSTPITPLPLLTPAISPPHLSLTPSEPLLDQSTEQDHPAGTVDRTDSGGREDPDLHQFSIPLLLKNRDRWEDKHKPVLHVKAKYLPYPALRQQFWRAMLRQYDTDENGFLSKVEITTMLDSLGSTLQEATIDSLFERFPGHDPSGEVALSYDSAVRCLEDLLDIFEQRQKTEDKPRPSRRERKAAKAAAASERRGRGSQNQVPTLHHEYHGVAGEEGQTINANDLADDDGGEEHVVEIRECPICHQPRMKKKSDADIITHIATCASQDWRQVNNIVMAGFVTASQAQRKWYSKVVTKIGYGGYKLGANSANILVQDRVTGQINEERMSVYVRLGIRLLYKGLSSRDMEKKRIRRMLRNLSVKQGRKFDDPSSAAGIQGFINFHRLDMSEVLLPTEKFLTFNEFFYRKLKPDARPCSAPDRPVIVTSPADCRTVVFNSLEEAQKVWVKGREFTVERLFGDAYPEDVKRYTGGSLGIFRLAPQDYHRFHIPVDGIMDEPKPIAGEYYTVNPMAIRSALDVYGENVRVLVPIDSDKHGRVMVVCVGAMMVGSTVITRKAGDRVARAEELGYFKFGGSTLLLLFEPGQMTFDEDLVANSRSALETLIRVGMSIGHSLHHSPHDADKPKNAEDVTQADKRDARRRIGGSLGPGDGSHGDPLLMMGAKALS